MVFMVFHGGWEVSPPPWFMKGGVVFPTPWFIEPEVVSPTIMVQAGWDSILTAMVHHRERGLIQSKI
jgi:hypothetical protein